MTEALSKWINQDVGLSIPITALEKDFANGYYLGELFSKLHLLSPASFISSFKNNSHPYTLHANFTMLSSIIQNMGIKFSAHFANDIMKCKVGAVSRLLLQVRQLLDEQVKAAMMPGSTIPPPVDGGLSPSRNGTTTLPSIYKPISSKGFIPPRSFEQLQQQHFQQQLKETVHMSMKEKHMKIYLSKYEMQGMENEENARSRDRQNDQTRLMRIHEQQQYERNKLAYNQKFTRDWNQGNMVTWRENMEKLEEIKQSKNEWKQKTLDKSLKRTQEITAAYRDDVLDGINNFEKNLERIGVNDTSSSSQASNNNNNNNANVDDEVDVSPLAHTQKFALTTANAAQLQQASEKQLAQIHEKCAADRQARKERERRRRKVLVEQNKQMEENEKKHQEELWLQLIQKQSIYENSIKNSLNEYNNYYSILKNNSDFRIQQEIYTRQQQEKIRKERDDMIYSQMKLQHENEIKQELDRFQQLRLDKQQQKHEKTTQYCRGLVSSIVDIVDKTVTYRELSDQALVPPKLWREWMEIFVKSLPTQAAHSHADNNADNNTTSQTLYDSVVELSKEPAKVLSARDKNSKDKSAQDKEKEKNELLSSMISSNFTNEQFQECLSLNAQVAQLIEKFHVPSQTSEYLDDVTLSDYLHSKNEWAWAIESVMPNELTIDARNQLEYKEEKTDKKTTKDKTDKLEKKDANGNPVNPITTVVFLPPLHPLDSLVLAPSNDSSPFNANTNANVPANTAPTSSPLSTSPLFSLLVQRIFDVASGKTVEPDLPVVSNFPLHIAIVGKPFSGKSTQADVMAEKFGLKVIRLTDVVNDAINLYDELEKKSAVVEGKGKLSARTKANNLKNLIKTPLQLLAQRLKKHVLKGEVVPDDLYVSLIVERIKSLRAEVDTLKAERQSNGGDDVIAGEGGWVLDGFPTNATQATLLEKELSGFELPKPPKSGAPKVTANKKEKVNSRIARPPSPPPHVGPYPSALHLVIRLDVPDETIYRRGLGKRKDKETGESYHLDFSQPDSNSKERLELEQQDVRHILPELLLEYETRTPDLNAWYDLFATMKVVDNQEKSIDQVKEEIRGLIRDVMANEEKKQQEKEKEKEKEREAADKLPDDEAASPRSTADSVSPSPNSSSTSLSLSPDTSFDLYSFNSFPFYDQGLAELLANKWSVLEQFYIDTMKSIFRTLRHEREITLEYFASTRKNFFSFLRRPDAKQFAIDTFVKNYNAISADLRSDVQTKEELHIRVDELSDMIWKICDTKRDENENELQNIVDDIFIDQQLYTYIYWYQMMCQCELDRYLHTIRIIQDVYSSCLNKIIYDERERDAKSSKDEKPLKDGVGAKLHITLPITLPKDYLVSKLNYKSKLKKDAKKTDGVKKDKASKDLNVKQFKKLSLYDDNDPFTEVIDLIKSNMLNVDEIIEQIQIDPDLLGQGVSKKNSKNNTSLNSPPAKSKPSTSGANAGGSASGKRKNASQTLSSNVVVVDPRIKHIELQFKNMIEVENAAFSQRIRRVHRNAMIEIHQLKYYYDEIFLPKLDKYLGMRLKGESNALDILVEYLKQQIEEEKTIINHIKLEEENCFIEKDILNFSLPSETSWSIYSDQYDPLFTASLSFTQIIQLIQSLSFISSSSVPDISTHALVELIERTIQNNQNPFYSLTLPSKWKSLKGNQWYELLKSLEIKEERIDYIEFLILLVLPPSIHTPTLHELLELKRSLEELDSNREGELSWEEFSRVKLWFEQNQQDGNDDSSSRRTDNPIKRLKEFFFHLFAVERSNNQHASSSSTSLAAITSSTSTHTIAYIDMLMYLCYNDDYHSGIDKLHILLQDSASSAPLSDEQLPPVQHIHSRFTNIFTTKYVNVPTRWERREVAQIITNAVNNSS